jgi:methylphosphotriester-DNA--protein-cysteine methyltransferase
MLSHIELGSTDEERKRKLASLVRRGEISLAGYNKAKIYGLLHCKSGKRMKMENRVFFKDEKEALQSGYRPCGNCLPEKYKLWKVSKKRVY